MSYRFRHEEVEIAYDQEGFSGDPVVLVHGGWDDRRTWDRVVPGLSVAFQVLAYDRRGHGESSSAVSEAAVRDDAHDLAELLEATEFHPAHLLAQGYGALPALRLAVDRPELVRGIALHEPPALGLLAPEPVAGGRPDRPEPVREAMRRAVTLGGSGRPEAAAEAFLELVGAPGERWENLAADEQAGLARYASAWAREMSDPETIDPPLEPLRSVAVPVLATSGAQSPGWAKDVNARLVTVLPNASSVRLSEGGHFIQRTDPDLLVGVVGSFLLERNVPPT